MTRAALLPALSLSVLVACLVLMSVGAVVGLGGVFAGRFFLDALSFLAALI